MSLGLHTCSMDSDELHAMFEKAKGKCKQVNPGQSSNVPEQESKEALLRAPTMVLGEQ